MTFDRPVARLAEGIDVMRLLWDADGPVDYEGKRSTSEVGRARALALRGRPPPIWIAAHGPQDARADRPAGRRLAADEDRASGTTPARSTTSARRPSTPAATPTTSRRACSATCCWRRTRRRWPVCTQQPLVRFLCVMLPPDVYRSLGARAAAGAAAGFHELVPAAVDRATRPCGIVDAIPPEVVRYYAFCGTPEQVAEEIVEYHGAGLRHLICWNITAVRRPRRSPGGRSRRWASSRTC